MIVKRGSPELAVVRKYNLENLIPNVSPKLRRIHKDNMAKTKRERKIGLEYIPCVAVFDLIPWDSTDPLGFSHKAVLGACLKCEYRAVGITEGVKLDHSCFKMELQFKLRKDSSHGKEKEK